VTDRTRDLPSLADLAHLVLGGLIRVWLLCCYRVTIRRATPHPRGAVLYACNHRSFLDPPMAGMWGPVPVCYFARASLWRNPVIGRVLDIFSGIPVDRDNPGASSMKGAIERLKAGKQVLVNAEAGGGRVALEVLDAGGRPLAGFSRSDCRALAGDGVRQPVRWRGGSRAPPAARSLRVLLRNARLYAIRLEE